MAKMQREEHALTSDNNIYHGVQFWMYERKQVSHFNFLASCKHGGMRSRTVSNFRWERILLLSI